MLEANTKIELDEETINKISHSIASMVAKRYSKDILQKSIKDIVHRSVEELKVQIDKEVEKVRSEYISKLHRRFEHEIQPKTEFIFKEMLAKNNITQLISDIIKVEFRSRARNWARSIATGYVSFSFDDMFRD